MNGSRLLLALGLVATLLAAAFAPDPGESLVAPTPRAAAPGAGRPTETPATSGSVAARGRPADVDVLAIRPRDAVDEAPAAFGAPIRPPAPPRPVPVAASAPHAAASLPPPPPPPQAPALPFRVLGRYVDGGEETLFLQHAERAVAVRVGDVLDGQYRVESLAAGVLTLIYLPLNQRQTLDIGETP